MVVEEELLQSVGLTKNESAAYLGLALLGQASASAVAEKSGLQRTLVYDTLKKLVEGGFASQVEVDGKRLFQAAGPAKLRAVVEERQNKVLEGISQLVPLLEKTRAASARPAVWAYTGIEGLKTVFTQEIEDLPEGGVLKAFNVQADVAKTAPVFMNWWHKRRIAKKITLKGILTDSGQPTLDRGKELESMEYTEIRFLKKTLSSPVTYHIFGSKAAIMSVSENEGFGMLIESKAIAKSLEENFDYFWKELEPGVKGK